MANSKNANSEARETDLHKSGRINTKVETVTEVVDNTTASEAASATEYEATSEKLSNGMVRVTYGEPVGGRVDASEASEEEEEVA